VSKSSVSIALVATVVALSAAGQSTCFGTVAKGRLEGGEALPSSGSNFSSYSSLGESLGRTFVHSAVRDVVATAYRSLEITAPGKVFVFGESGWKDGGRIKPHRTHQNGLSVDFMVPVVDKSGRSVPLPTGPLNKFGYDIEFDRGAKFEGLTIDFDAIAEHLYQLHLAARAKGIGVALVIFDEPYLPRLFATAHGSYLKQNLKFMQGRPWVRHDEHYHVDFAVTCKPLAG
jgi:penicillin-insensitive murein DD-endopeptidase